MWNRAILHNRLIGGSDSIEPIEEKGPQRTTNLNSGHFSISKRPAFGTRESADVLKGLPDLPL